MGRRRRILRAQFDWRYIQVMKTPDPNLRRERWKLIARLARALETPMLILSAVWLVLLVPLVVAVPLAPAELVGHDAPFNSGVTVEGFADGRVLYRLLQKSTPLHLLSMPVQGGQPLVLTSELASDQYVRGGVQISPDQQTVAFLMGDPADQYFSAAYEARLNHEAVA